MIAKFGRWSFRGTILAAIVYLAALLFARLLAFIPDFFEPWTVGLIPVVGVFIGLFALRRPSSSNSAREIDTAMGTKDLYLTDALARANGTESSGYSPIVSAQAEEKAKDIQPSEVVSWRWQKPVAVATGVMSILLGARANSLYVSITA